MSIGKAASSSIRPTAMGLTLQSSTYGQVIPVIYGRVRSSLYLIWLNGLRKQGSSNKIIKDIAFGISGGVSLLGSLLGVGALQFKKPPTYVANVDFLLGHNPIAGVLQFWRDKNEKLPLLFTSYSMNGFSFGYGSVTIPDANFYFLLGVTSTETYSVTFNDYGGSGSVTYSGSYEVPLWNACYAGPDPTDEMAMTFAGYYYRWVPGSGATVYFDSGTFSAIGGAQLNLYYAQLDPGGSKQYSKKLAGTDIPVAALRLEFEPVLGNGTEYGTPVDYSAEQILYPHYAGLGSPNYDLGSEAALPAVSAEVVGSHALYPTGDADFADMAADIFKQGQAQSGFGTDSPTTYSPVQRGLNCFNFPGVVQKKVQHDLEAFTNRPITYDLPNTAGNILIAACTGGFASGVATISDTAGNTWIPLASETSKSVWYAVALAAQSNAVTMTNLGYAWQTMILETGGVDTFDQVALSPADSQTASLTVTASEGQPTLLVEVALYTVNAEPSPEQSIPQWTNVILNAWQLHAPYGNHIVRSRVVRASNTYSITDQVGRYGNHPLIVLISFTNSQPVDYPRPLGDILDRATLLTCRQQCTANGLWGSLLMDSQKKASDWLKDIYTAMNAAPVWSGFQLKSIPYSEVSAVGNGVTYTAPTAAGPVANITEGDYAQTDGPPVTITRVAQVDVPNLLQIQHPSRAFNYHDVITGEPETAAIAQYGPRKDSPRQLRCVNSVEVARKILGIAVRRRNYLRNGYAFALQARWALLEPMDLITISDAYLGLVALPVRITTIREAEDRSLQVEAEPFIYGCHAPTAMAVTENQAAPQEVGSVPDPVNEPIFIEPVPALYSQANQRQLWVAISDPGGTTFAALDRTGWVATADTEHYGYGGNYLASRVLDGNLYVYWWSNISAMPHWLAIDMGTPQAFNSIQIIPPQDTTYFALGAQNAGTIELYVSSDGVTWGSAVETVSGLPATGATVTWVLSTTYTYRYFKLNMTAGAAGQISAAIGELYAGIGENVANYGGCQAYLSTDGGVSYNDIGTISGSAVTGVVTADWPAATDPDTTNDLLVDLTESLGTLAAYQVADEDNFVYPCYVDGFTLDPAAWTATADSDLGGGYTPDLAIDGDLATFWASAGSALPHELIIDMGSVQTFSHIMITMRVGYNAQNPKSVELYVSSDGMTWGSAVETATGLPAGSGAVYEWGLSASYTYQYFKVVVTANQSGNVSSIAEIYARCGVPGAVPYELMTYAVRTMTPSAYRYTLSATGGNKLRRAVFGVPAIGQGALHVAGSRFAFIGAGAPGILKLTMDPMWIGIELHFKFVPFNTFGAGVGSLSDAVDYTYTPTGTVGSVNPNGVPPQVFTVNGA